MMKTEVQGKNEIPSRRRGRPTGKNRVPLSLEERRARNAFYERERRNQAADAMTKLAEAVGCDPNIANADLLATVISQIRRNTMKNSEESLDDIRRVNENLESQIAMLQQQLGLDDETFDQLDNEELEPIIQNSRSSSPSTYNNDKKQTSTKKTKKRKRSPPNCERSSPQEKRVKTGSDNSLNSRVESQIQCIPPTEICVEDTQYILPVDQLQLQGEIIEGSTERQAYAELQTVHYSQMLAPEAPSCIPVQEWSNLSGSQVESPTQSLIVVPSPQEAADMYSSLPMQPNSSMVFNLESCEMESEISSSVEPTLELLTDSEKALVSECLEGELLQTFTNYDQFQMPVYDDLSQFF